jgi:HSP20 family protein
VRYGSLSRSLPLPEGVTEADITANYKDGVLEIRIPEPKHEEAKKIAISKAGSVAEHISLSARQGRDAP